MKHFIAPVITKHSPCLPAPYYRTLMYVTVFMISGFGSVITIQAQQLTHVPVEVRIARQPIAMKALGRNHLVYELYLTHFGRDSLTLEQVRVYDADRSDILLSSVESGDLMHRVYIAGNMATPQNPVVLSPGSVGILYQWVTLDPRTPVPEELLHEFVFKAVDEQTTDTLVMYPIPVPEEKPKQILLPVSSGEWAAIRGPSNGSGHRRSFVTLDAKTQIPERFAIDWVKLGKEGHFFEGNPQNLSNWFSYNEPVSAVSDGQIVLVRENISENIPLSPEIAMISFTPETVTGNTVVIDTGNNNFAVYAHLRPGSIQVQEGEVVKTGQTIGRIGNSGHSLAPHLHFHIQNTPDPLNGEGLSFVFDSFELIGQIDSLPNILQGAAWEPHPGRPARTVASEIPMENMVIKIH